MSILVVSSTFNEHSVNQTAVFWRFLNLFWSDIIFEVVGKADFVYRDVVAARLVLHYGGEKCLREEKTGNPVDRRLTILDPVAEELNASLEIFHP